MDRNNNRSQRPSIGQMRFDRRRRDQRRNTMIGIIVVLAVAIAVFGFIVLAELDRKSVV